MNEIFVERDNNYSLLGKTRRRVNLVRYGTETVSFLAPKIWDILPKKIKNSESVDIFKKKKKKELHGNVLCKTYALQEGFIRVVKIKDTYHLTFQEL